MLERRGLLVKQRVASEASQVRVTLSVERIDDIPNIPSRWCMRPPTRLLMCSSMLLHHPISSMKGLTRKLKSVLDSEIRSRHAVFDVQQLSMP